MLYTLPFAGHNTILSACGPEPQDNAPGAHGGFTVAGQCGGFTVRTHWQAHTAGGEPVDPGELLGLPALAGVTWDREAIEAAAIGWLDCTEPGHRWRTGAGSTYALYRPAGAGHCLRCRPGVTYRVYAVKTVNGELWCQITPPPACAAAGSPPALWVRGRCGGHLAKAAPQKADT